MELNRQIMSNSNRKKDTILFSFIMSILIIGVGFSGIGCTDCGCGSCGDCGCGSCGGCGCGEVDDVDDDGDEDYEDSRPISNVEQQPVKPPSICEGTLPNTDITITGTKSPGATYNTYSYSYRIKACGGGVAYDIYLKGIRRLSCESGYVAYERSKSGSNSVTSPYDFGVVCFYSPNTGEKCSALS